MTDVRTPTALWSRNDDGSWRVYVPTLGRRAKGGGGPGPGGSFGPSDIQGADNIEVTIVGDTVIVSKGGHVILAGGVENPWRPQLDFQGNVTVTDDPDAGRTIVNILGANPGMRWRGEYDPDLLYDEGDVVSFGDAIFVWNETDQGFGFGAGPFGEGPFGGVEPEGGWGSSPFGAGPFGG